MSDYRPHIGTDESGKGDYFGPLVVAGVYLEEKDLPDLLAAGVKDSKRLTDKRNLELARVISCRCRHSVVAIGPEKYNQLYSKMRNLNLLLAWGHARAIENILEEEEIGLVVSDKFGNRDYVRGAMLKKGRAIELIEKHHAEEDPAVACASILARSEFLRRLKQLAAQYKFDLPKGAAAQVSLAAARFKAEQGMERLAKVAKLHFKITKRL